MKTIKIAHLYYDLMNYFGEQGNITALKSAIKYADVKVSVDTLSIDDKIDFNAYDIFYIGMGSKINQELVRKDILKYKNDIKKIIDKKMFIATGNSYELFGKNIDGKECIGIFNFSSKSAEFIPFLDKIFKIENLQMILRKIIYLKLLKVLEMMNL